MNEHTAYILRRFSGPEWERFEALGFPLPDFGSVALANWRTRVREEGRRHRRVSRVPCLLVRGAVKMRVPSMRVAADRLGVSWHLVKCRVRTGKPVNGWRVRRAA